MLQTGLRGLGWDYLNTNLSDVWTRRVWSARLLCEDATVKKVTSNGELSENAGDVDPNCDLTVGSNNLTAMSSRNTMKIYPGVAIEQQLYEEWKSVWTLSIRGGKNVYTCE